MKSTFLAPLVRGGTVCVRIQGIPCRFYPENREFEGWGMFQPVSPDRVRLVRKADRSLVRKYLDHLTPVELIVADHSGSSRASIVAQPAGSPVRVEGIVPVHLVKEVDRFRHIVSRFDGFNFWFDRVHPGRNPATAAYLRKALHEDLEADALKRSGLLPQEKKLYEELLKTIRKSKESREEQRLKKALKHGGAMLDSFRRRGEEYQVNFTLDGNRHTTVIHHEDLTVLSAGICLSDEDEKFDLQSLVGVLREARSQGEPY